MRIGSEYRVSAIGGRHWDAFAERNGLDADAVKARIDELGRRLPEAFREAAADPAVASSGSDLPARLTDLVAEQAERCRAALA
jgi:hypothetical protein